MRLTLVVTLLLVTLAGCHGNRALTVDSIRANVVPGAAMQGSASVAIEGVTDPICTDRSQGVVIICNTNVAPAMTGAISEILSQHGLTTAATGGDYRISFRLVSLQSALSQGGAAASVEARWQLTMDSSDGRRLIAAAESSRSILSSKDMTPLFRTIVDRVGQLISEASRAPATAGGEAPVTELMSAAPAQ